MTARNSLTQHLRFLEELAAGGPERFIFADGRYTIRVANDLESRRKAYQLVYRLYLEKEYAKPNPSNMWLSIFDALPETATLLVERTGSGAAVGALTVVFDSPMGLPADKLYRPEMDALRTAGRRLSEIISLGVAEEEGAGSQILVKLFNFAYIMARRVRGATDFIITVNPRHAAFYGRKFRFIAAGPERSYEKVGGAPAVLLSIPLNTPDLVRGAERARTIYSFWLPEDEESQVTAGLRSSLRPMSEQELGYFFVAETDVLARASPGQRAHLRRCRPVGATALTAMEMPR